MLLSAMGIHLPEKLQIPNNKTRGAVLSIFCAVLRRFCHRIVSFF